jgi:hypothetical protein
VQRKSTGLSAVGSVGSSSGSAAVSFGYEYAGKTCCAEGKVPRMTLGQIEAKYGRG